MRLYKLIGLEILALEKEYKETLRKIKEYQKILSGRKYMDQVIKEDLKAIKEEFAVPRRTVLEDGREAVYEEPAVEEQEVYFVMDRFGYSKLLDKSTYDRNAETVEAESAYVVHMMNTDKVCLFTHTGVLHQVKAMDIPFGKLRDKGTPIDNLCRYDGTKETVVYVTCAAELAGNTYLFATKEAMVKLVPGGEFITNNRMVASTKLADGDELICILRVNGEKDAVIQTGAGIFLRFPLEEISVLKKNSRGVRGIRLGDGDSLEAVYLLNDEASTVEYKGKTVHLNRLKIGKRDGKGSKVRL